MWPKDYLTMCHIFYSNFSVNFLQSTWIRPQKNLPNQDTGCDITCQSPASKQIIIRIDIAMPDSYYKSAQINMHLHFMGPLMCLTIHDAALRRG